MTTEHRFADIEARLLRLKDTLRQLAETSVEHPRETPAYRLDETLARISETQAKIGEILARHNEPVARSNEEFAEYWRKHDEEYAEYWRKHDEEYAEYHRKYDEELAEYRRESAQMQRLIIRIAEKNGWLDENGDISSPF